MRLCLGLLLLIVTMSVVTGCGFKLRGTLPFAPQFKHISIESKVADDQLVKILKQSLKTQTVNVVEITQNPQLILVLSHDQFTQYMTTVSSDDKTRNVLLTYQFSYQIKAPDGRVLVTEQHVVIQRDQIINMNQILSDTQEQELLKTDMIYAAVTQLLIQLNSPSVSETIKTTYAITS